MHTVIKICDVFGQEEELVRRINSILPSVNAKCEGYVDGLVCGELSLCENREDHFAEVIEKLCLLQEVIVGLKAIVDMAIWPQDYRDTILSCFLFTPDVIKMLAATGVHLEFSVYYMKGCE